MTCSVPNLVWKAVDPFYWIQRPVVWSRGQHLQAWAQHTHPYTHMQNIIVRVCSQSSIIIQTFWSLIVFCLFLLRLTEGFMEIILNLLVVTGSLQFRLVPAGQFGLNI